MSGITPRHQSVSSGSGRAQCRSRLSAVVHRPQYIRSVHQATDAHTAALSDRPRSCLAPSKKSAPRPAAARPAAPLPRVLRCCSLVRPTIEHLSGLGMRAVWRCGMTRTVLTAPAEAGRDCTYPIPDIPDISGPFSSHPFPSCLSSSRWRQFSQFIPSLLLPCQCCQCCQCCHHTCPMQVPSGSPHTQPNRHVSDTV